MRLTEFRIAEGQRVPWWAGIAYYEVWRGEAVVLPIPFHWIAGAIRAAWFWVRLESPWKLNQRELDVYVSGRDAGADLANKLLARAEAENERLRDKASTAYSRAYKAGWEAHYDAMHAQVDAMFGPEPRPTRAHPTNTDDDTEAPP